MRLPAERFGVARGVQRGRFHKTLTLAGYGSPKVRHEPFAKLALQFAHQVTNPNSVHAAENALDEIPNLSVVIEVEDPDLERFSQLEHAIHAVFVALRSHIGIAAAFVARADGRDRGAPILERYGMEDVAVRCVIQHLAQGASVSEQIELRTLRDLQQKLTERFACAVRKGEELEKLVRLVLLPPRNKRRPFAVEHEAERAD